MEVVLEAGTYRVAPEQPRGVCFPLHQAANLTVRGSGQATKIVITDPAAGGFSLVLCHNVRVANLAIDYDPVPFCQGTIRAVDVEAGSFDLEVEAGFPTPDAENFLQAVEPYGKWGMIMDPATRRIRSGTPDHYMTPRWEHCAGRVWRFFTAEDHYRRNLTHMRVGDAYVHLARCHGSAVLAQGCEGVCLENLTVHAAPGLAVGLVANRGEIAVRGLQVRFAPGTNRLLTTDADGVHCQQNRRGPVIENVEDTTGAGVVLANEPDWPEGPVPWGITIRGNRFLRGGTCLGYADSPHGAALSVRPVRLGHGLVEAEAVHEVTIENNEFRDRAGTALFLGGASGVAVSGNRITAAAGAELRRPGPAILIEGSSRVRLMDNSIADPRPGTTAAVEIGAGVAPGELGVSISALDVQLDSKSPAVRDRRPTPPATAGTRSTDRP